MSQKIFVIIFYLHKSVSISTKSCQSQSCVTRIISAVIIHVVDADVDDIDTVAIAIDIDSPGGTGIQTADGLGWRELQRSTHVGKVKISPLEPVPYWLLLELFVEYLVELLVELLIELW